MRNSIISSLVHVFRISYSAKLRSKIMPALNQKQRLVDSRLSQDIFLFGGRRPSGKSDPLIRADRVCDWRESDSQTERSVSSSKAYALFFSFRSLLTFPLSSFFSLNFCRAKKAKVNNLMNDEIDESYLFYRVFSIFDKAKTAFGILCKVNRYSE